MSQSATFRTGTTTFTVLEAEDYPEHKVSPRFKRILEFRPGQLVAVGFRGVCIPNITGVKGVLRLTKIQVGDQVFARPSDISRALGITEPMVAYPLRQL